MKRVLLRHALAISAASLLATTAYAQSPNANPNATAHGQGQGKTVEPTKTAAPGAGEKAGGKLDKAADKTGDKAKDLKDKVGEKADNAKDSVERTARKAKQHDEQKAKLGTMLKGPMDEATKQELRRHAERLAKIERIKSIAETSKDNDSTERATKLMTKETTRHDTWMQKHVATTTTITPGTVPAAQPDSKGGAK